MSWCCCCCSLLTAPCHPAGAATETELAGCWLVAGPPPPSRTLDNTRIDSGAGTILATLATRAQPAHRGGHKHVRVGRRLHLPHATLTYYFIDRCPSSGAGWAGMCRVGGAGQRPCLGTSRSDTSDQISAGQPAAPRRWRPGPSPAITIVTTNNHITTSHHSALHGKGVNKISRNIIEGSPTMCCLLLVLF